MPLSSRLFAFARRCLRGGSVRVFALAIALAMVANALAAAAMPLAASPSKVAVAAMADEHCAHHAETPSSHKSMNAHGIDCPCCLGKTCACGPIIATVVLPPRVPAALRSPAALPNGDPPSLPAAAVQPMLRPPIA
jgi:hypothetical protein